MSDPERKRSFDAEYANFEVQEQLLELMEKAQMSVRTLVVEAGLSKTTVQKFRTGDFESLTIRTAEQIAKALGKELRVTLE